MNWRFLGCLFIIILACSGFGRKSEGGSVAGKDVYLYSEAFGDPKNSAILLNAGAGSQSIVWDHVFCKKLADKGYFVIRYDYRDTGLSSQIDFEKNPYTVRDLSEDTLRILKKFKIKKAHFLGFSMGGQVGQFVAAYHPDHISSLILLGTSTDFKPGFDAFSGEIKKDPENKRLSPPKPDYVAWATRDVNVDHQTLDEKVDDYIKTWRRLDGDVQNFNENYYRKEALLNYTRSLLHTPYIPHAKAMKASFEDHQNAPALITVPTLIIHGAQDPVFGVDHGRALHSQIKNSKLIVWKGFAHAISPQNHDRVIEAVDQFLKSNVNS